MSDDLKARIEQAEVKLERLRRMVRAKDNALELLIGDPGTSDQGRRTADDALFNPLGDRTCDHPAAGEPAQDGGRDAGCRVEPGDGEVLLKIDGLPTISICADDVEGFGYDLNEAADGTKPQSGVTVRLQPDHLVTAYTIRQGDDT